jgi:GT2 family glycosyltransferase
LFKEVLLLPDNCEVTFEAAPSARALYPPSSPPTSRQSSRLAASIVVPAWNAWPVTRACLESLRPTLGPKDEVIVVDNGSVDETPRMLRRYPFLRVLRNEENQGFAKACNQGAALASRDVLVFLNNDTLPVGRWLDGLLGAFADEKVAAAGARSNFVSGPQLVEEAQGLPPDPPAIRRFARQHQAANRARTTPATRLVGFCLAVRREAFVAVGGFDEGYGIGGFEDDDLCMRLMDKGWSLVIADECFVYHRGHATFDANGLDWYEIQKQNQGRFEERLERRLAGGVEAKIRGADAPLVSACMIVRDEEPNLLACISSLTGFADEVVVYDTGSKDNTVELARSLGARVAEGTWEDDFSKARNQSLELCRGEWILWIDADETLALEDPARLRRLLKSVPEGTDALAVTIENLSGSGIEGRFTHVAARLFRRERCMWSGRLHEQVVLRDGGGLPVCAHQGTARIFHRGYLASMITAKAKEGRNAGLAALEVASGLRDPGAAKVDLGRSLWLAGRLDEALAAALDGARSSEVPTTRRFGLMVASHLQLALGRPKEALETVLELRSQCEKAVLPDELEALVRLHLGEPETALELSGRIGPLERDDDGFEHGTHSVAGIRAGALVKLGRHGEAADVLLDVLARDALVPVHLAFLVGCLERAGRDLCEIARAIPPRVADACSAQLAQLALRGGSDLLSDPYRFEEACSAGAEQADLVLESLYERSVDSPSEVPVLAAAAVAATAMRTERAIVWAARLRSRSSGGPCPLLAISNDGSRTPLVRARAAAAGFQLFRDERFCTPYEIALKEASAEERRQLEEEVPILAPALAGSVTAQLSPLRHLARKGC